MSSTHKDGSFAAADGSGIYFQYWSPATPARAVMLLVHGAGEHSGRYAYFVDHFTSRGYAVAALDHPGHGRSEGRPGYVEHFDVYLGTLRRFHAQVSADFSGLPQILVGHSMGGLISCHYLLQLQEAFVGCVLSGPAIMTELQPGAVQMAVARLLSVLLPKVSVLKIDPSGISRDPAEVRRYREDPLVFKGKACARMLVELIDAMARVQSEASRIRLPLLLLHGGSDVLASPEGSRFLNDHVGSSDKTLRIYPGLYHEIFNEPEREQVFADVGGWCDSLLSRFAGRRAAHPLWAQSLRPIVAANPRPGSLDPQEVRP